MPPVPLRCFFCFVVVGLVPVCSFVVTRSTIRSEFCVDIVSFSDPNVLFGMLVASDLAPCRTNERFRGTLGAHEWIPLGSRFAWAATWEFMFANLEHELRFLARVLVCHVF